MATNYNINYEDKRFTNVETEKQAALNNINNTYNNMINSSDQFYQDQINAAKDYSKTQQEIQQANTDFAIEQINQQKEQAGKDYTKEQAGAYVDWQKQSNQYGVNAEQQAAQGLGNTGYSESSQVSMYNTYQNRVATARESFNKAILNYDNSIKEAQLANNSKLAEIAYNALQTQLELSLQGFQYKNSLLQTQIEQQQATEDRYYSRWQDVLTQMNQENQFAESIRQYEQNYAEQVRQYNQNYAQQEKEYEEGIRQFDEQMAYYRQKDAEENAYKIKQLEEQKRQFEKEYALKQQQMAQEQAQWEKEYALSKASLSSKSSSSGGSGGVVKGGSGGSVKAGTSKAQVNTQYYSGSLNPDTKYGTFNTTDKNGVKYQPNNVGGSKLSKTGLTISNNGVTQNVWKAKNGKYYYWEGRQNKYISIPANTVKGLQTMKTASGGFR